MSSAIVLADSIEELVPTVLNAFSDAVKLNENNQTHSDALPWVVVRVDLPTNLRRALAGTRHGATVTIRTTIAGVTADSIRAVHDLLSEAFEGVRPAADGWRTSPIRETNATPILEDQDVTLIESNRRVVYSVVEWTMTASTT